MGTELVVVGAGRMGRALIDGVRKRATNPPSMTIVARSDARAAALRADYPDLEVAATLGEGLFDASNWTLLSVKPDTAESVCRQIGALGATRVLSVVAGMPAQRLEAALGEGAVVVRAMPNTASLVGEGMCAISGGSHASSADLDWAESIMGHVGQVVRLAERHLDAVVGVSGSGGAYLMMVAEAMIEAGVLVGLPRDVAHQLTSQTFVGVGALLTETQQGPEELRQQVTSPGGTTAAALRVLEMKGLRSAIIEAVVAATERSRSLAR